MKGKQALLSSATGIVLLAGAFAAGQNVGARRHPNLAAAQRLTAQAEERIITAQQANEWDMAGHAAKAKDLLDQANRELKMAAETSNHK